jgi:hypothetical protein
MLCFYHDIISVSIGGRLPVDKVSKLGDNMLTVPNKVDFSNVQKGVFCGWRKRMLMILHHHVCLAELNRRFCN